MKKSVEASSYWKSKICFLDGISKVGVKPCVEYVEFFHKTKIDLLCVWACVLRWSDSFTD